MTETHVRRLRIVGRVQGVGFRWFVREQARALRLAGWVQNEPGGEVLLEVGGETSAVAVFVEAVQQGPPGARVDAVHDERPERGADSLPRPFTVQR